MYGSVTPRSKKEKEVREGSVIMYIPDLGEMTLPEITLWRLGWFWAYIYIRRGGAACLRIGILRLN